MTESVFRRLCEAHPVALQRLSYQYRMNRDVCDTVNAVIYGGLLRCGNAAVASRKLVFPSNAVLPDQEWLRDTINPERRVIILNTDAVAGSAETKNGESSSGGARQRGSGVTNLLESRITAAVVSALTTAGIDPGEIGVLCPYRSQLSRMRDAEMAAHTSVEIDTIDRYQGRDKDVIVMSCVRNNSRGEVGDLLRDWRRVNVALSRAKDKLIMVGSVQTLRHSPIFRSVVDLAQERGWVYQLPNNCCPVP